MPGVARERRPSEEVLDLIWGLMKSLVVEVWYGEHLVESAEETAEQLHRLLDKMVDKLHKEEFPGSQHSDPNRTDLRRRFWAQTESSIEGCRDCVNMLLQHIPTSELRRIVERREERSSHP